MDLRAILAELGRSTDTFATHIGLQADRIPDRTALKFEEETVSYGAYDAEVNRLAAALRRAVHRHDMAAAGLGHEAHAVRAHPCHFAFHFVRSCRLYCVFPITNA